ncbi:MULTISPECIES: hypothetical protein [unclassified Streptomyces]|uniref:hypothetical protein n=1 Tax=unclassified Streptomyces TaxID=2593676 RepID=UPI00131B8211|nr:MULTISPECIES: hypothetical protein [unclassified Streptomyces]
MPPPPARSCPDCDSSPAVDHVELCAGCGTCNECHSGWHRDDPLCVDCAEAEFAAADNR